MKIILSLVVLLLIGVGIGSYFYSDLGKTINNESEEALLSEVQPLYNGVQWYPSSEASLNAGDYGLQKALVGFRIVSEPITNIDDYSQVVVPFYEFYDNQLMKKGWSEAGALTADGPSGSVWGYSKGGMHIILESMAKQIIVADGPFSCPCDVTLSIFVGRDMNRHVQIKEIGVELLVDPRLGSLEYAISYGGAHFSTKSLAEKAKAVGKGFCEPEDGPLGSVYATNEMPEVGDPRNVRKFGDKYVFYLSPQDRCSSDPQVESLTIELQKLFEKNFNESVRLVR
ncbi:MAG: hypothetical protein Q7S15_02090 [bacterium]|nr:hypothetical protein [bacterium]